MQIITITDGEPTGPGEQQTTTRNVILRAKDYLGTLPYGSSSVSFMFAQACFFLSTSRDGRNERVLFCLFSPFYHMRLSPLFDSC